MKIRFGVGLGTSNVLGEPADFATLVDTLEELRFDSLWISERATGPTLDPLAAIAFAAGRTVDDDHFGTVLLYSRGEIPPAVVDRVARVSPGTPIGDVVPTGADELTGLVRRYVASGLTKFVLVPVARPASWRDELEWLSPLVRPFEETS